MRYVFPGVLALFTSLAALFFLALFSTGAETSSQRPARRSECLLGSVHWRLWLASKARPCESSTLSGLSKRNRMSSGGAVRIVRTERDRQHAGPYRLVGRLILVEAKVSRDRPPRRRSPMDQKISPPRRESPSRPKGQVFSGSMSIWSVTRIGIDHESVVFGA